MNDTNTQDQNAQASGPPTVDTPPAGPISSTFTMDSAPPTGTTTAPTTPPAFTEPVAEVHPGPPSGVTSTESAPITAPPLQKLKLTRDKSEPQEPVSSLPAPVDDTKDSPVSDTDNANDAESDDDQALISIKQQALEQLQPLISHLEQTPEEKFRTLMMMIQAADDQSLIDQAYQAAEQITDDKLKAQALLDIVNEINYFTHKGDSEDNS